MSQSIGEVIKVQFVDDEPNILSSLKRGLIEEQYIKFFANTGDEALGILEAHDINVIVSDMKMPVMNGLELLKIVSEKYPDTVKIVLSGYNQLPQVLATINTIDIYKYIVKPWDMEKEFIPVLRQAIEQHQMKKAYRQLSDALEKKNEFYQKLIKANDERYMKLKNELSESHHFAIESMDTYQSMVEAMLVDRCEIPEAERVSKIFNKIFFNYFAMIPHEMVKYSVDKTVVCANGLTKAWYELLVSKSLYPAEMPQVKLGDLEHLNMSTALSPKHFEHFLKLILFDLGLMHIQQDHKPHCVIQGFYHKDQARVVINVQTHELVHPMTLRLRDHFVKSYTKVFELLDGELVHYSKLGKEHFIITLPVQE